MTEFQRIDETIDAAAEKLAAVSDSPRLDAELMLARAIDVPRSYLYAHPDDVPDELALERFGATLARRLAGEPMAYITGVREFWSIEFMVTPATLVPRPETELLVDVALRELPRREPRRILDLGTGSGAVAIAIARERPLCEITATDISAGALAVAAENARQLALPNVEFVEGDWCAPLAGREFDLIVSNPPYVRADDPALDALGNEPRSALVAGDDGLDALRVIARDAGTLLAAGAALAVEHGAGQQDDVAALLDSHGWSDVVCHRDHAGLPRVTVARRASCSRNHQRLVASE